MRYLFYALLLSVCVTTTAAQPVVLKRDNNNPKGSDTRSLAGWEETMMLQPTGPCRLLEMYIYHTGTTPGVDTIRIVGDPAEGALSPTSFVWGYNELTAPIVIEYDGTPGWDTIDLRDANLRSDGYDRFVIQHAVGPDGPWFAIDNNGTTSPLTSFLYDPTTNNSLGFPGNYYAAQGDYLIRLLIQYDLPRGVGSELPPTPTLEDVAKSVGLIDGAGAALKSARVSVADWNGDGWDDIAIGSKFFQNKGDGTFQDVSTTVNIAAAASVWGDYDNDGRLDVYAVNGGAGDRLYRNNGDGTFTDVTANSGLSNPRPTVTPIWLDYDNNGWLDLFIANGRTESGGQEVYFPDQLFRNNGDGTFTNETVSSGIGLAEATPLDCWGASATDYNNDRRTDIFVATYRLAPDFLYRNDGDGTFTEVGAATGVRGVPTAEPIYFGHGIGCDWGDYNNDGAVDLAVGNLGHPDWRGRVSNPTLLFRNNGAPDYGFTEVHRDLGIKFFEMNAGVVWLDLDLDGLLDLWHCQYAYQPSGTGGEPYRRSRIYLNGGPDAGYRFTDRTWHLGPKIHGAWTAARGDFDNDGDLDLVVASPTDAVKLFRNSVERKGRWIAMRLEGDPAAGVSKDAYGTSVVVHAGGKMFLRDLHGGGGGATASQNSNELHFGLGSVERVDSIVIRYPNGRNQTITSFPLDTRMTVEYSPDVVGVEEAETGESGWRIRSAEYTSEGMRVLLDGAVTLHDLRVEVIDARGERVAAMTDQSGKKEVIVPIDTVIANGVYFVRVIATGQVDVEKVMVGR